MKFGKLSPKKQINSRSYSGRRKKSKRKFRKDSRLLFSCNKANRTEYDCLLYITAYVRFRGKECYLFEINSELCVVY